MPPFPDSLETDRLRLERLRRATTPVRELNRYMSADASGMGEVSEYVPWDPHRSVAETRDYLAEVDREWRRGERATYRLSPTGGPDAGEFAGITSLTVDREHRTGELALWLRKPFWGRGYSGERAAALLRLAFDDLDLDLVGVSHQEGNENSKRAIRRYIGAYGGQFADVLHDFQPTPDGARDLHRYTVSREQYRDATA